MTTNFGFEPRPVICLKFVLCEANNANLLKLTLISTVQHGVFKRKLDHFDYKSSLVCLA